MVVAAPVFLLADGPVMLGIWCAVLAPGLLSVAITLRPGEGGHLGSLIRPLVVIAIIPVIAILIQAMPLPSAFQFNNPIWQGAERALGQHVSGRISVDVGATIISLCRYLAWLGTGVVACAVTVDRKRAEWVLYALTTATACVAALLIVNAAGDLRWLDVAHGQAHGGAQDAAALGLVLTAASAVRAYERFETRRATEAKLAVKLLLQLCGCVGLFIINAIAITIGDDGNGFFAGVAGLAVFLGIVVIRRLGLGFWGGLAIAIIGCALTLGIVHRNVSKNASDITVSFTAQPAASKTVAERMLADSSWLGTGAGTYRSMVAIYRNQNAGADVLDPPSAAAELAIEGGRPTLWFVMAVAAAMAILLFGAGLKRGRDSFYSSAGAAVLISLMISAFGNAGLFEITIQIMTGSIFGLALAQSRSRSLQ